MGRQADRELGPERVLGELGDSLHSHRDKLRARKRILDGLDGRFARREPLLMHTGSPTALRGIGCHALMLAHAPFTRYQVMTSQSNQRPLNGLIKPI